MGGRRGFTIMEILVAGALGLLVTAGGVLMVVSLQPHATRQQQRILFSQSVLQLQRALESDLGSSGLSAVHRQLSPSRIGLAIQPLQTVDAASRQVWSDQWVVYSWGQQTGILSRWLVARPSTYAHSPGSLSSSELGAWLNNPPAQTHKVADNLKALRFEFARQGYVAVSGQFLESRSGRTPVVTDWNLVVWLRNQAL